jgi:hypothetical protein
LPDFSRVIDLAYHRILGRPADPSGLENYNRLMNAGLTEAEMREALLRSGEYADKNPDRLAVRRTAGRRMKKKPKNAARGPRKSSR